MSEMVLILGIIAYCIAFTSLCVMRLDWAIVVLAALLPTYQVRFSLGPIPFTLLEIMILILGGAWVFSCRLSLLGDLKDKFGISGKALCRDPRFVLATASMACILSATISLTVTPDIFTALGAWKAYFIEPFMVGVIGAHLITTKKQIMRVIAGFSLSALVMGIIAVIQAYTGWHIPDPWFAERRAVGLFDYPNAVGLYLAPLIPLMVAHMISSKGKIGTQAIMGFTIILSLLGIVAAKTEAALVALVVSMGLFGLILNKTSRRYTAVLAIAGVIVVALSPALQATLEEKLFLKDWSGQVRQTIWRESGAMLRDHWVTGAGLSGYQTMMTPYHNAKYLEIFLYPHNIVMNVWSELGLLGLFSVFFLGLSWCVLLVLAVIHSRGSADPQFVRAMSLGLLASALTLFIHGLVDVPYFKNDLSVQFWLLIALSLSVYTMTIPTSRQRP